MEFEVGTIFYIVITLVAIIVGLLGRKKKPAGSATDESGGQSRPSFLENLEKAFTSGQEESMVVDLKDYEEDLPVEEESVVEPEVETIPSSTPSEDPTMMETYKRILERRQDEMKSDIFLSDADAITEPLEVIHLEEDRGTDYFEVVKEFNAATAVVYSAIINRIDY